MAADRHRTEVDADRFHVVYLVTDSDSDANIVKRLQGVRNWLT